MCYFEIWAQALNQPVVSEVVSHMSSRWWAALLGVCVATAGACSGESGKNDDDDNDATGGRDASSAGGVGGTSQGEAGEHGDGGSGATASAGTTTLTTTGSVGAGTTLGTGSSVTGNTTQGTTGSMPGIPATWTCSTLDYGNGTCDCGCGAPDSDCASDDIDECEVCTTSGSCACPGKIDPEDTTHCIEPPVGWTCLPGAYDDGAECHCGCGIEDPDCEDSSSDSCDVCYFSGSCAGGACPSSIDADDNSRCDVPEDWTCSPYLYGDATCHCGCGVVDMDCSSASRDACDVCWTGCTGQGCPGPIDEDNNAICTGLPANWTCAERFFGDGSLCHCGCGALDSDCASTDIEDCDRCDFEGSCSAGECPGTIDPEHNMSCDQPPPPSGWTCFEGYYADGSTCHCGCGVVDLDCADDSIDSCQNCEACGSSVACPLKIDPDDITSCAAPPAGWECRADTYLDGYACHCGCGVLDPDCESLEVSSCDVCSTYYGGCVKDYDCNEIEPEDNTRCVDSAPPEWDCDPDVYGDGACDCGCGVRDLDCASADPGDCEFCDAEGSCSDTSCADIDEENNAVCVIEP